MKAASLTVNKGTSERQTTPGLRRIRLLQVATAVTVLVALSGALTDNRARLLVALTFAIALLTLLTGAFADMLSKPNGEIERLRSIAMRLITNHDSFRASHSKQLFDSVAQQLAGVQFELAAANERLVELRVSPSLATPREIVALVLEEVRQLSVTLHPGSLDRRGLPIAIRKLARVLAQHHRTEVEVTIDKVCANLSPVAAMILYAGAEESLNSAMLHQAVFPVRITLTFHEGTAKLEVSDDGSAIDADSDTLTGGGTRYGHLRDMLELIGGTLRTRSEPQYGTTVVVAVPCSP